MGSNGKDGRDDHLKRDTSSAQRWFKQAQAANDYEHSIDCYIHGLQHDPGNVKAHEELYQVALRRHVAGGKPASLKEKLKGMRKDPLHKMLHAERLWAMSPKETRLMVAVMEQATKAMKLEPDLDLNGLVRWIGDIVRGRPLA